MIGPTVTIRRAGTTTDEYGNTSALDWSTATDTSVTLLAPPAPRRTAAFGESNAIGRLGAIYGYTLYFPTGTDVSPLDRVVLWGDTFEVEGEAGRWTSGAGTDLGGLEVDVVRAS
jgi:hypothetical protein